MQLTGPVLKLLQDALHSAPRESPAVDRGPDLSNVPEATRDVLRRDQGGWQARNDNEARSAFEHRASRVLGANQVLPLEEVLHHEAKVGGRVGASGLSGITYPEAGRWAPNHDHHLVVMVNGINITGPDAIRGYASTSANVWGAPVVSVIDDEESIDQAPQTQWKFVNFLISAWKAFVGWFSSKEGSALEPSVDRTANILIDCARDGVPVTLCGHSKGSIVASNALSRVPELLEQRYPGDRTAQQAMLAKVRENTQVVAVAPVEIRFPKGWNDPLVVVREDDPFYKLAQLASEVRDLDPDPEGDPARRVVELNGRSHDFDDVTAALPETLVRDAVRHGVHGHSGFTRATGAAFAHRFIHWAGNGRLAPQSLISLERYIGEMSQPEAQSFRRGFRNEMDRLLAPSGGKIGEYQSLTVPRTVSTIPREWSLAPSPFGDEAEVLAV